MSTAAVPAAEPRRIGSWPVVAAWAAIGVLLALLLFCSWQGPDIFYHIHAGEAIARSHTVQPPDNLITRQPGYVNIYWLFQLVCWLFYAIGGAFGVSVLMALVWFAVVVVSFRTAGFFRHPAVGLPAALAAVLLLQTRFDPRPEVFSYLFLALQLFWLTTWDFSRRLSWRRYALFGGTEVLWTNVHGYFPLGPAVVALLLVASFLRGEERAALTEMAKLLGVTLVATLVTPLGPRAWGYVFALAGGLKEMRGMILELLPPTGRWLQLWTVNLFWAEWGALILAAAWLAIRRRWRRPFALALVLPACAMSATSYRNMPLVLLLGAPLWGAFLDDVFARPRERGVAARPAAAARTAIAAGAGLLALGLAAWMLSGGFYRSVRDQRVFGRFLPGSIFPVRFGAYLDGSGFRGRIYNDSTDAAYVGVFRPGISFYIDQRYVDLGVAREYFTSLHDFPTFMKLQKRFRFDAAVLRLSESAPLLTALLASPDWRLAYTDLHRAFLVAAASDAARSLAPAPPSFYEGEDLSLLANGSAAIQWVNVLARTGNRELLLAALEQLAAAPGVPSYAIQYALQYGIEKKDDEVISRARALYPRLIALRPQDRLELDRVMRLADARRAGGR